MGGGETETHQRVVAALLELERQLPAPRSLLQDERLEVRRGYDVPAGEGREARWGETCEELVHDVGYLCSSGAIQSSPDIAWRRGGIRTAVQETWFRPQG